MWGSRYFTARYWNAWYFSATGSDSIGLPVGIISTITDVGNGAIGFIGAIESGMLSSIVVESGVSSSIDATNMSYSPINTKGNGIESLIS